MLSMVHSRFCSLPIFCALSTHQKNTSTRHTMANRRYHPRRLSVVPFLRRLLRLRQQEHVSRVINGDGDGGSAVSCNHIYGPPFGLSGAGDLSITIATGQRNCRRTRNTTMSATAFAAAFSLLLSPLLLLSPSPSPLILLSPLLQFLLLPLLVDCYMCPCHR